MSWFSSLWAWIAEHPITVIGVVAGLVIVIVAVGVVLVRRRARERQNDLYYAGHGDLNRGNRVGGQYQVRAYGARAGSPEKPRELTNEEEILLAALAAQGQDPSTPEGALEIEAGRLVYQIPKRMWLGVRETVEVRLGRPEAEAIMQFFGGRGEIRTGDMPIVETMSVSLLCGPGAFDIEARSDKEQLVKHDLVKGTPLQGDDFGKWVWFVTPRERGKQTLLVKVSAAIRDSRGLPTTKSLPDKVIAVTVRVHFVQATVGAVRHVAPGLAWAVVTALVGVLTKDYWWPAVRDTWWPAVQAMVGMR